MEQHRTLRVHLSLFSIRYITVALIFFIGLLISYVNFIFLFIQTEMFSNGTLKVTLQAPPSITKTFKGIFQFFATFCINDLMRSLIHIFSGFMVMGFDKATSAVIGTFKISSTNQYSKTLDCSQYDVNFQT
jgi:hypothetical protein